MMVGSGYEGGQTRGDATGDGDFSWASRAPPPTSTQCRKGLSGFNWECGAAGWIGRVVGARTAATLFNRPAARSLAVQSFDSGLHTWLIWCLNSKNFMNFFSSLQAYG